jgi:hypothetical protein
MVMDSYDWWGQGRLPQTKAIEAEIATNLAACKPMDKAIDEMKVEEKKVAEEEDTEDNHCLLKQKEYEDMVAAPEEEIKNFEDDEDWEEQIQKGKDKVKEAEEEIVLVDKEDDNDDDDNDEIKKLKEKNEDRKSRTKPAKDDKKRR